MDLAAFAYSRSMQVILAFVTCSVEFFLMYMIAGMILNVFKVNANNKQKVLFAFLAGTVLQTGWAYGIYFLNSMVPFTPTQFMIITTPNPIAALLYCWLAIKIFHLSPIRSIKMMGYIYLFWCLIKNINKVLGSYLFLQDYQNWNYLLDIMKQCAAFGMFFTIFSIVNYFLQKKKINISFTNNRFFEFKKELLHYFFQALFVYIVTQFFPLLMHNEKISTVLAFIVNLLFVTVIIGFDIKGYYSQIIENNNVHINTLVNGMEAFRGIKHDFYNILQTYSGYLEIGEIELLKKYHSSLVDATTHAGASMELSQRLQENPAFVSLLIGKLEYAERLNVMMHYSLQCDFSDFYIDNMDMCRMLACLLDGAIERAAASTEKKIYFSLENKNDKSKLLIITNSTDAPVEVDKVLHYGITDQENHGEARLTTVRNIIGKYGNCSSQIKYFNLEMSVYIEVQRV